MSSFFMRRAMQVGLFSCWLPLSSPFLWAQIAPPTTPAFSADPDRAYVTSAQGQVSIQDEGKIWAVSSGEQIPIRQLITTGADGFARFQTSDGSSFELSPNSRVIFRQNASTIGDLLDVLAGRVRIHLNPKLTGPMQRVFCPVASFSARYPTILAIAVDEDDTVRVDVVEGEVRIQHLLLPRSEPTLVKAIDAILIQKNQPISRRVDRGTLYRYTVKPLHDLFAAITPGHAAKPEEQLQAQMLSWFDAGCMH